MRQFFTFLIRQSIIWYVLAFNGGQFVLVHNALIDRRAWPIAGMILLAAIALWFVSVALSFTALLVLAGHLAFFRDPRRTPPEGKDPVSPADGQIVDVSEVFENRYLNEEAVKIGIFLTLFIPHVNRAPLDGKVSYLQYKPGKFLNALKKNSVNLNESNWIGIDCSGTRVLVRQIAGTIARRICCDIQLNQHVRRGEKVGIICYGSRMECYLPKRLFRSNVRMGDRVKAGETVIGAWLS